MADEEDYSSLPVEDKIVHKVWKVRQDGYTALNDQFTKSRSPEDPCFSMFSQKPELVKLVVTDSNVVAQEGGLQALCLFLEYGGTSANATKLKNAGLITSLCEKGLSSSRAGTKTKTVEAILWLVELLNSGDSVVELIVPFFDNRLPKLVAASVNAVYFIIEQFGCQVASPKPVIPKLAKLFSHADKNVRAQATNLTVEIYKWMGQGLTLVLMDSLRPVQQKDLQADFEKVAGDKPEQKRLTRKQKEELAVQQETNDNEDVDMDADTVQETNGVAAEEFDPFLMLEPVEVLLKLPSDLHTQMASSKWKDRKEALDEVHAVLSKAPKLAQDDYTDLVRIFAKCMKDANIQVVQLAANAVEFLSKGLKEGFHKYQHLVVGPMIERSKEKKPSVADALANALDAIYESSSLNDVLDEIINGMKHKTPQVKISSTDYLRRCLANTTVPPKRSQIDAIMESGVKLLSDSQEPIRQAATDMIGTLMKITGERELLGLLEKIDENRLAKVRAAHDKAQVKCTASAAPLPQRKAPLQPSRTVPASSASKISSVPLLRKPPTSSQAIPSKRGATSPAKKAETSKLPSSVRSLTGRLLVSPSTKPATTAPEPVSKGPSISAQELQELESLRKEKQELPAQNRRLSDSQSQWEIEKQQCYDQIRQLQTQLENLQDESATKRQELIDKDAEILHWKNESGNYKLKILSMEQVIQMLKLNPSANTDTLIEERRSDPPQPLFSPTRTVDLQAEEPRGANNELSSRVDRLSIEGSHASTNHSPETQRSNYASPSRPETYRRTSNYSTTSSKENVSEDDNWKKAAEVTAQLKARIEKMKQRNRLSLNRP